MKSVFMAYQLEDSDDPLIRAVDAILAKIV